MSSIERHRVLVELGLLHGLGQLRLAPRMRERQSPRPMSEIEARRDALGAELIWWRADGDWHTLVTIAGPLFCDRIEASRVRLTFELRDIDGALVTTWRRELARTETVVVDSRKAEGPARGVREGV